MITTISSQPRSASRWANRPMPRSSAPVASIIVTKMPMAITNRKISLPNSSPALSGLTNPSSPRMPYMPLTGARNRSFSRSVKLSGDGTS